MFYSCRTSLLHTYVRPACLLVGKHPYTSRALLTLDNDIDTVQADVAALNDVVPTVQAELERSDRRVVQLKTSLEKKRSAYLYDCTACYQGLTRSRVSLKALCIALQALTPPEVVLPTGSDEVVVELSKSHHLVNELQDAIDEAKERSEALRLEIVEHEAANARETSSLPSVARLLEDQKDIKEAGEQILLQLHQRLEFIEEEQALLQGLDDFGMDDWCQ